ncbi:hypothetical protein M2139_000634 [Enterococcus sp. PF1-24]|uniref:helix-turn-helix domain-containing protein n=1 Tax=unclassified Enterococcus TaxID=2608891 RepID=UPI00247698B8|nr:MULTISPECIES: helix-turn-helix domain-containing protein [unclassified Enterococcus]MDH6363797.1 hypothetical protein [Enterococcus sp. PFB1-1]MDH6400753.1 hypothetical protein [Enterococcus sp. PF1-24]
MDLLTKKEQEKISFLKNILTYAYSNPTENLSFFVEKLNLPKKKLKSLLDSVTEDLTAAKISLELKLTADDQLQIITDPSKTDYLSLLKAYYTRHAKLFSLCEDLFLLQHQNLESFAEKQFLSRSVAYRFRQQLTTLLKEFDLTYNINQNGYLVGKERQIRCFFTLLFYEATPYFSLPITPANQALIEAFNILHYGGNQRLIQLWLQISIFRNQQGFRLKEEDVVDFDYQHAFPFELADFTEKLHAFFTIYFSLLPNQSRKHQRLEEKIFYIFYQVTNSYSYNQIRKMNFERQYIASTSQVNKLSAYWIEEFSDFFNYLITSTDYTFLYTNLVTFHAMTFLGQEMIAFFSNQANLGGIEKEYPITFQQMKKFVRYLAKGKHASFFKKNQSLLYLYNLITVGLIESKLQPVQIALVTDLGEVQKKYFEDLICHTSYIAINFIDEVNSEVDLLITTSTLNSKQISYQYTLTVQENPAPEEFEQIKQLIYQIYVEKNAINEHFNPKHIIAQNQH